jgi:hypothetical protein
MDRQWITHGSKFTPVYIQGVHKFMEFARAHCNEGASILCPCQKCLNITRQPKEIVEYHLHVNGMAVSYTKWSYHGEDDGPDENYDHSLYQSDDDDDYDDGNENHNDHVDKMLDELHDSSDRGPSDTNFYAMLIEEAKKELHEGCTTETRLSFIMKMLYVKSYNWVTNRAFDQFMAILCAALRKVNFPKSYAEAKSVLS